MQIKNITWMLTKPCIIMLFGPILFFKAVLNINTTKFYFTLTTAIVASEGINESVVRRTITRGLAKMKENLKKFS